MLGIRILLQLPAEAEYAQDYEVFWSYEGPECPNAAQVFQQKIEELTECDTEYIVQVKDVKGVWKTHS